MSNISDARHWACEFMMRSGWRWAVMWWMEVEAWKTYSHSNRTKVSGFLLCVKEHAYLIPVRWNVSLCPCAGISGGAPAHAAVVLVCFSMGRLHKYKNNLVFGCSRTALSFQQPSCPRNVEETSKENFHQVGYKDPLRAEGTDRMIHDKWDVYI